MRIHFGPRRRFFLPLVIGLAICLPSLASADVAIALTGDPAPGSGGGTFSGFFQPDLNDAGQVTFRATLTGGTASQGLFIDPGTGLLAIAVAGDLAPDSGGATFSTFGEPVINNSNFVAFSASLSGGTATWGLYSYFGGSITTIATNQTIAPGTAGGNYTAFGSQIAINDAAEVAFVANVGSGSVVEGLFVEGAGVGRAVFLIGDPAPTGVNGTYFDFSPPAINDAGAVAVTASFFIAPSGSTSAVVVEEAGVARAVARVGDPAPDTGTGTYVSFNFSGAPGIDAAGNVYFKSTVTSGTASDGLFVDSTGTDAAVAIQGDPGPGTGGNYRFFSTTRLGTNDAGDVGFSSSILGGSIAQGLFLNPVVGPDEAIVLLNDPVPDVTGGTFISLGTSPAINGVGQAALLGTYLDGGGGNTGVFLLPEPAGVVQFATALISVALLARRRVSLSL